MLYDFVKNIKKNCFYKTQSLKEYIFADKYNENEHKITHSNWSMLYL